VTIRVLGLMFARVAGWMVLLARSSTSEDAGLLVLRHEVTVLRRQNPRPGLNWAGRAVPAAVVRLVPKPLRISQLVAPDTLPCWHRRLFAPQPDRAHGQDHERRDEERPDMQDPARDTGDQDHHANHGGHQVDRGRSERGHRGDRRRPDGRQQRGPRGSERVVGSHQRRNGDQLRGAGQQQCARRHGQLGGAAGEFVDAAGLAAAELPAGVRPVVIGPPWYESGRHQPRRPGFPAHPIPRA
jgi:hypothetical protein